MFLAAAAIVAAAALPATAAPRTYNVTINQMKFGPVPPGLRVGDTIVWINRDIFQHSATARDGSFNLDLPAGKSGKMVLRRTGKIAFYCKYHPGMTGVLQVAK